MAHKNFYQRHTETLSLQDRIADRVTQFAGSMPFVYIHIVWFGAWVALRAEPFPFGLLTMIVSLEAIFLSTLVMISQNRSAERDKMQAQHQYEHLEVELKELRALNDTQLEILKEIKALRVRPTALHVVKK